MLIAVSIDFVTMGLSIVQSSAIVAILTIVRIAATIRTVAMVQIVRGVGIVLIAMIGKL